MFTAVDMSNIFKLLNKAKNKNLSDKLLSVIM